MDKKPKYLSGAQKRKRIKERDEKILKNAKIENFFVSASTSTSISVSATPEASEPEPGPVATTSKEIRESGFNSEVEIQNFNTQSELSDADVIRDSDFIMHVCQKESNEVDVLDSDLALYSDKIIDSKTKENILKIGSCKPQHNFAKDEKGRSFSSSYYSFIAKTGLRIERIWLCYSPRLNAAYCEACWLFADRNDKHFKDSWCRGITDWQGFSKKVKDHENSVVHVRACFVYDSWKKGVQVDNLLEFGNQQNIQRWREIIKRIIDVIIMLATCDLPFRGHREGSVGTVSTNKGNFIHILELLAKYDPLLESHLKNNTNRDKYLSPKIQNEIIHIISTEIKRKILNEIKDALFFTIICDTTQDISKIDQLSQIVRYVLIEKDENNQPVSVSIKETFVGFFEVTDQTSKGLESKIVTILEEMGLNLAKCRGQGYDGASNMSGVYNGLQALIKLKEPTANYVHCAAHNLNLVLNDACSNVPMLKDFYDICQKIYVFFGHSIKRWNDLRIAKNENIKFTLKTLCTTRWSSRWHSVSAIRYNFVSILKVLSTIILTSQKRDERDEAQAIKKKIERFDFIILLVFQTEILENIDLTSKLLQKADIGLDCATNQLTVTLIKIRHMRTNFADIREKAVVLANSFNIKPVFENKRKRKVKKFYDELLEDERLSDAEQLFKVEIFFCTLDILANQLKIRFESINAIQNNFIFLYPEKLTSLSEEELYVKARNLQTIYHKDLSIDFPNQILSLRKGLGDSISKLKTVYELADHLLIKNQCVSSNFPDVSSAVMLFLTLPVSVASAERSFSKLKIVKTYLRNTMGQQRLSDLSLISIEHEFLKTLNIDEIINDFAKKNSRRTGRFL